ncbi:hypothetical protein, partial [Vibrio sp. 10N.261.46.A3]|uniref:hypothetical protein n=1 Tax=Vibrio sp. 10N.261.46.A3 TaxID=3229658 RepID=UPI00354F2C21
MSLLYSEQRENTFLLILIGGFSIGLALFGVSLDAFVMRDTQLFNTNKKSVTFVLAPEPKVAL